MQLSFSTTFRDTDGQITRVETRNRLENDRSAARLERNIRASHRSAKVPGSRGSAIEYARWLAQRDGIDVTGCDGPHAIKVDCIRVERSVGPAVRHAKAVHFGSTTIVIPHAGYDATRQPVEYVESALPLAA